MSFLILHPAHTVALAIIYMSTRPKKKEYEWSAEKKR
jgi:hypothetical protein